MQRRRAKTKTPKKQHGIQTISQDNTVAGQVSQRLEKQYVKFISLYIKSLRHYLRSELSAGASTQAKSQQREGTLAQLVRSELAQVLKLTGEPQNHALFCSAQKRNLVPHFKNFSLPFDNMITSKDMRLVKTSWLRDVLYLRPHVESDYNFNLGVLFACVQKNSRNRIWEWIIDMYRCSMVADLARHKHIGRIVSKLRTVDRKEILSTMIAECSKHRQPSGGMIDDIMNIYKETKSESSILEDLKGVMNTVDPEMMAMTAKFMPDLTENNDDNSETPETDQEIRENLQQAVSFLGKTMSAMKKQPRGKTPDMSTLMSLMTTLR